MKVEIAGWVSNEASPKKLVSQLAGTAYIFFYILPVSEKKDHKMAPREGEVVGRLLGHNSPQGYPCPNPCNLWICCLGDGKDLASVIKFMMLELYKSTWIIQLRANKSHDSLKAKNLSQLWSERDKILRKN